jgi:hypothetical protein
MARKRSLAAALMSLPQALREAVLKTIPEEAIAGLEPEAAIELGVACDTCAREIAERFKKGGADGR